MRPWTERVYGIPPEQVIGSSGGLKFEMHDGKPVIVKLPTLILNEDKDGKPVGIERHIGRRPVAAFGKSDGDLQMLEWTCDAPATRLCLLVHHTDAEREWVTIAHLVSASSTKRLMKRSPKVGRLST
ncbi:protein of unknown function [Hyphomicrobium sp. MC1]|nr:protein of unknown function [Hyphomicrobium sp. MC1]